jgi:hypothetical protein
MDLVALVGVVAVVGGIGGFFNALHINTRSDLDPTDSAVEEVKDPDKQKAVKKAIEKSTGEKAGSFFFNIVSGALAAAVSWAAYGPYALEYVFGGPQRQPDAPAYGLTLAALATAVVIGLGGPRWLTNERDKALLKQAADEAAGTKASPTKRKLMERADPKQQAQIAGIDIG